MTQSVRPLIILSLFAFLPVIAFSVFQLETRAELKGLLWLLEPLPYFFFAAIAFLGMTLNQTRILFSTITLALSYALVHMPAFQKWAQLRPVDVVILLSAAIPLSHMLILASREARLLGRSGLLRLLIVLGVPALIWTFQGQWPGLFLKIRNWDVVPFNQYPGRLPDISLVLVCAGAVVILASRERAISFFSQAILIVWFPLYFALNQPAQTVLQQFCFAVTGATLLGAVLRMYWQRVYMDELTGVPNRRALDERLLRLKRNYCIAMADIDHFKNFNDRFGHDQGDHVLRLVAKRLESATQGRVYRYGGEEFTILFDGMIIKDSVEIVEGARKLIASRPFTIRMPKSSRKRKSKKDRGVPAPVPSSRRIPITISVGVAEKTKSVRTPEGVIKNADMALYKAKKKGRNCTCIS